MTKPLITHHVTPDTVVCGRRPTIYARSKLLVARCSLLAALLLLAAAALLLPGSAAAHPLGNFSINRYARVEPGARAVAVIYALDMAEVPTFQEMERLDRNRDKMVSDDERAAYLDTLLPELARGLHLTVAGQALPLAPESGSLSLGEGQGGLAILRVDARFRAALPEGLTAGAQEARLRDTNYDSRLGWKEIVVRGTEEAAIHARSAGARDLSDGLRSYPDDFLQSPLDVREAAFQFEPGMADPEANAPTVSEAARIAERTSRAARAGLLSRFADSAATRELTLPVALVSLLAAVFWGALHALGPGHGKTVVGAYLVGSRGTARHAVFLGLTVTATHTAGVYLLGLITLSASHIIVPERLYPILSFTSGLLVVVMGLSLLWARLRPVVRGRRGAARGERGEGNGQRATDNGQRGNGGLQPALATVTAGPATSATALRAMAPARTAVVERPAATGVRSASNQGRHGRADQGHSHGEDAGHSADGHWHGYTHNGHTHDHGHAGDGHEHGSGFHRHGPWDRGHSHAVPGQDGTPVNWRTLLVLGIYGGLIPCPTAIVVLLTSIALNRVGFGLLLVVAFSTGLALVLTGIGLMLVYAGRTLSRLNPPPLLTRAVPVASAALVVMVGVLLTLQAAGVEGLPVV